jgi:hypothetical protein
MHAPAFGVEEWRTDDLRLRLGAEVIHRYALADPV